MPIFTTPRDKYGHTRMHGTARHGIDNHDNITALHGTCCLPSKNARHCTALHGTSLTFRWGDHRPIAQLIEAGDSSSWLFAEGQTKNLFVVQDGTNNA